MLFEALNENITKDLLATRDVEPVDIIYRLLVIYQPGGSSEKTALLKTLQDPPVGTTSSEVAKNLREWMRHRIRAQELKVTLPDSTVQIKAVDMMTDSFGLGQTFFISSSVIQGINEH